MPHVTGAHRRAKILSICAAAAMLTGCAWLPSQGPTTEAINDQATINGVPRYDVIEVDKQVVDTLRSQPSPSFQETFGHFGKPAVPTISVGDTVIVTIWEMGDTPLFGAGLVVDRGSGAASGSRGIALPAQIVSPDGTITVPFVGQVAVGGRTPAEAQAVIQAGLAGKTASPQVIVTVPQSFHNTVTVAGEVVRGARVQLPLNGARLLDVIAMAGGAQAPMYDVYVKLSRDGTTTTIPFQTLVDDPSENIYAWPEDVLALTRVPHTFAAFGATGRNAQIQFEQEKLDMAQALAKSSGLLDERADPAGVYLLRAEPLALARQLDPAGTRGWQQPTVPVLYHFNMKDPNTYFLAQDFPVQNNDLLYAAGAKANVIQKVFGLFGTITAPLITGAAVNNSLP